MTFTAPQLLPYLERLLNGETVEWKTLGEVAEFKRGQTVTQKTAQAGVYPVISGGQQPAYYINQYNRTGQTITVAGSGAYAGFVMFWNEPIFVSDAFSIKANEEVLLPRYVFHFLLNKQSSIFNLKRGSGVPHVYAKDLADFSIPLPPLRVQARIVEILDKFTQLETELETELEARNKQYDFYRNRLLDFAHRDDLAGQVEWKTLGEVFNTRNGYTPSKTNDDFWKDGTIPWFRMDDIRANGRILYDSALHITPQAVKRNGLFKANSIILATSATIGEHALLQQDALTNQRFTNFEIKEELQELLLPKFAFYYFFIIDEWCKKHTIIGNFPSVDTQQLMEQPFPLPPLSEQRRIVEILDRFDTLTNSISEGLPREIALRRKQYEYYRDALLRFPPPAPTA